MATYNGEKYLYKQINSIINQLRQNDEVIISDDSSTDRTIDIIKSFGDKRIKLFENNKFHSPIYNLEYALHNSTGDMIFLADQDDIWIENKVKIFSELLGHVDLVVSDCVVINENDDVIVDSLFQSRHFRKSFLKNLIKNSYVGCCMAFSRKILDYALPFPKNIPMHDIWLGMIGEVFGETYFCEDKLVLYRRHDANTSPTCEKSPYLLSQKIRFRYNLLLNLIKRYIEREGKNKA